MQTAGAIRVLRVITRLNIGGPSIQAIALSDRLSARGFETRLVHGQLGAGEGDMRYLLAPGVRAQYLASLRRPVAPLHDLVAFARLLDIMRDFRPHIVHTHMAKAGTIARAAAAFFNRTAGRGERARVVHTYHGHVLEGYFGSRTAKIFTGAERQLAKLTDAIVAISPQIRNELLADFRKNDPRIMRRGLRAYLTYLDRYDSPAARLCDAGVPAWVVHAEKGDGGLTSEERSTLKACPRTTLVTIPGTSYFIPNEESERVAGLLVDALDQAVDHTDRRGR